MTEIQASASGKSEIERIYPITSPLSPENLLIKQKMRWACVRCFWIGPYAHVDMVMRNGVDTNQCPLCCADAIPAPPRSDDDVFLPFQLAGLLAYYEQAWGYFDASEVPYCVLSYVREQYQQYLPSQVSGDLHTVLKLLIKKLRDVERAPDGAYLSAMSEERRATATAHMAVNTVTKPLMETPVAAAAEVNRSPSARSFDLALAEARRLASEANEMAYLIPQSEGLSLGDAKYEPACLWQAELIQQRENGGSTLSSEPLLLVMPDGTVAPEWWMGDDFEATKANFDAYQAEVRNRRARAAERRELQGDGI